MTLVDETDKTIHPAVRSEYERLKNNCHDKPIPDGGRLYCYGHARIDGQKVTCEYSVREIDGVKVEQFEYYIYRYFHRSTLP